GALPPKFAGGARTGTVLFAIMSLTTRSSTHHSPPTTHHYSYCQSGSSGCFRSHSGRRLCTTGITSKLYAGGGEVVAHSSAQASQGSAPAGRPCRSDAITLYRKIAKLGT